MEDDRRRPYSVLTKDEVKEKMNKEINDISEIFWVSKPDATVLLMSLRWNSQLLSERLAEDKEKLLTEAGLKSVKVDSNQDLSDSSCMMSFMMSSNCDEFYEFFDDFNDGDHGDDEKISTPFCSHKYSTRYWSKYLGENFFDLKQGATIICPHKDCRAAVRWDTIEKLSAMDKEMYEAYVLTSYLEVNKIKRCPAGGCCKLVEFNGEVDVDEYSLNVVCHCGHTFCWRCGLESHRPVTCNNAFDWWTCDLMKLSKVSKKPQSVLLIKKISKVLEKSVIESTMKPCPHCLIPINKCRRSEYTRFEPCPCCRYYFCWRCMKTQESHISKSGLYSPCRSVEAVKEENPFENKAQEDVSCVHRWDAGERAMLAAKSELEAFEKSNNTSKIIREGLMLIVQCRQFLKWSCVYEYSHFKYEASKKEYLRFLQDYANTLIQSYSKTLKEEARNALSAPTSTVTSNIGNYFYNFSKALKDGLDVVKVKHYDNFASGPYWLCDRCTYANTWIHMGCQMCYESVSCEEAK